MVPKKTLPDTVVSWGPILSQNVFYDYFLDLSYKDH